ncbi:MAG: hypothetical protein QXP41_00600 [Candidatus Nitrosocaldus sp.]
MRLLTTKNVKYLNGPPGRPTSPKGEWSIVGFVDGDCILAKQSTIIRVPPNDIVVVASYSLDSFMHRIKHPSTYKIDMIESISNRFGVTKEQATELCKKYQIPMTVDSRRYEKSALEKIETILKENSDGR